MLRVGIAGAGLLGRLLAWEASRAGHEVDVFDPAADAQPRFDGHGAAAFSAAGMLSPLAELDCASARVAAWGLRSLMLWPQILGTLRPLTPFFARHGSLLLAHRSDLGTAQRVLSRLQGGPLDMPMPEPLSAAKLQALEPALHGVAHAWFLPGEGQLDPPGTLHALHVQSLRAGVRWHWHSLVREVEPGTLWVNDEFEPRAFDLVFDARGLGGRRSALHEDDGSALLRGVRGETAWLHAPGHGLTRPVRLLHPRYRVYVVPRPNDTVVVGATEIESEDRGAVSLRSAVELMSAAYSVLPALAEARIIQLDANLRPAYPDNEPRIEAAPGLVRINGLFRHGWLLAPALIEEALSRIAPWFQPAPYPNLSECTPS